MIGPADRGKARGEAEQREGKAALLGREGHGRDGEDLRRHDGAGEALQHARGDQPLDRGRKAAEGGRDGEGGRRR